MKKTLKILGTTFITLLIWTTTVNGASFKAKVAQDKTSLKPGEEVSITLSVSNIDVEDGINVVEGTLVYNESVFETVTSTNFVGANNWSWSYNEETGKFLAMIVAEGETEEQQIGTIKLKAKATATAGTTQISINDIKSNDGVNTEISAGSKTISLTIKGTEVNNNTNTNTNINTNTNGGTTTKNQTSNTTANTIHASAGIEDYAGGILLLVASAVVSFMVYCKIQIG